MWTSSCKVSSKSSVHRWSFSTCIRVRIRLLVVFPSFAIIIVFLFLLSAKIVIQHLGMYSVITSSRIYIRCNLAHLLFA